MHTEMSCKHTSFKQCGQKPAYNDLTQFLLTRKAFLVHFLQS